MTSDKIKNINQHLDKLQGVSERVHDLSKKEKADCLKSVNWILINEKDILEAQIEHTTNEHTSDLQYMKLLREILG